MNTLIKKILIVAFAFAPLSASAGVSTLDIALATLEPYDLINWKVGDTASFNVSSLMGSGSEIKSVTKEEGGALWIRDELTLMGQKQVVDVLINKADGKILKMIQNGKEVAVPDDKVEIISQDYTEVTVPAGTFEAMHIVAKTKKVSHLEIWANPQQTVMEGTVKQMISTGFMDLTMELTSFKHGN